MAAFSVQQDKREKREVFGVKINPNMESLRPSGSADNAVKAYLSRQHQTVLLAHTDMPYEACAFGNGRTSCSSVPLPFVSRHSGCYLPEPLQFEIGIHVELALLKQSFLCLTIGVVRRAKPTAGEATLHNWASQNDEADT